MLALDLATTCGVCFDKRKTLHIGTVVGTPVFQYAWLKKNLKYDSVVIEELVSYNSRQPKILVNLAQRYGYVYHRFVEDGVDVNWIHPGTWRKNLSLLQSKAGTRELQIQLRAQHNTIFTLDEVDAVGVWLCAKNLKLIDIVDFKIVKLGKNCENA